MSQELPRRQFLQTSSVAASALALGAYAGPAVAQEPKSANDKIVVGVMGLGRGASLAAGFAGLPGSEVAYLCDVDSRQLAKAAESISKRQERQAKQVEDMRKILDDKSVDVLVVAAPDHWHAPATILACAAGKHVYVEKPCSHNPREGELAVEASRTHDRVVQMGTQRRSWAGIEQAMEKLHAGAIGKVLFSQAWYNNRRGSIGHGKAAPVPEWLNYELWQGPAPEREYHDNYLHYNWHWFWHWGTGELGNNGVHALDLCRWGLQVEYPTRVTAGGGKYRHDDDQETPDTHNVTYDFDGKSIAWQGLSWSPHGYEGQMFGANFYGEGGTMVLLGNGFTIYDMMNKEVEKGTGAAGDAVHLQDFFTSIREHKLPHADILEGHRSTLLCHLGNIAWRTGRTLHCDPQNGHIQNDEEAMKLWSREYRAGWEPKV
jgi:predicted dehydrogenase